MNSTDYCAAWTDSGFFLTWDDHHSTIAEAIACSPCAGGYVVAIERGDMRALMTEEEAQFQSIIHSDIPPVLRTTSPSHESVTLRVTGETLLEFGLRVVSAYGFGSEKQSEVCTVQSIQQTCEVAAGTIMLSPCPDEEQPKAA